MGDVLCGCDSEPRSYTSKPAKPGDGAPAGLTPSRRHFLPRARYPPDCRQALAGPFAGVISACWPNQEISAGLHEPHSITGFLNRPLLECSKIVPLCDIFTTSRRVTSATKVVLLLGHSSLDLAPPIAGLIFAPRTPSRLWRLHKNVMEVSPSVPAKTVLEFIAYAKANPGKINMASAG